MSCIALHYGRPMTIANSKHAESRLPTLRRKIDNSDQGRYRQKTLKVIFGNIKIWNSWLERSETFKTWDDRGIFKLSQYSLLLSFIDHLHSRHILIRLLRKNYRLNVYKNFIFPPYNFAQNKVICFYFIYLLKN